MKFFTVLLVVLVALSFGCKKDSEKYIAKVNDSGIKREKFNKIVGKRVQQIEKFGRKITGVQKYAFEKRLLDNLVNEEILLQEAVKSNVKVEDAKVTEKLVSIKARYPKKEEFEKILKQQELTEKDLLEMFKRQLVIEDLIKQEVVNKILIPEDEISKFYKEHTNIYKVQQQVKARHILLKAKAKKGSKAAKSEAVKLKAKLNKIRAEIVSKKKTFEAAAKEYSEGPSKTRGGDLGFFPKGRMAKEFQNVAFSAKINRVSRPFKTPFGFHILVVEEKKKARTKKFEEVKEEIEKRLKRQQSNTKVRAYIDELKKKSKIVSFLGEAPQPEAPQPVDAAKIPAPKKPEPKEIAKESKEKKKETK
jgi:peptidyl-prolyl cis-trans isomerase C